MYSFVVFAFKSYLFLSGDLSKTPPRSSLFKPRSLDDILDLH